MSSVHVSKGDHLSFSRDSGSEVKVGPLRVAIVEGGAAMTDLACHGIMPGDQIVTAIQADPAFGYVDVAAQVAKVLDGAIVLRSTDTTGRQLLVMWHDLT